MIKITKKKLKNSLYILLKSLFPPNCVVCDKEGELICNNCSRKLIKHSFECHVCHRKCENGVYVCKECRNMTLIQGIFIGYVYDNNVRKIIEFCKYKGYYYVFNKVVTLLRLLFKDMKKTLPVQDTMLVPVPIFFLKENMRGFNQSEKLCEYINDIHKYNYQKLLTKIFPTRSQVGKKQEERLLSQKGVFRVNKRKLKNIENIKNIVIVDDVMTSGSTLEECAKVIKETLPMINLYAFVIARGEIKTRNN
ncbi:MAG: hypothetical protein WCK31_03160 [bacterium]